MSSTSIDNVAGAHTQLNTIALGQVLSPAPPELVDDAVAAQSQDGCVQGRGEGAVLGERYAWVCRAHH